MWTKGANSLFETYSGIPEKASFLEEGFRILNELELERNRKTSPNGGAKNMLKQKREHLLLLHQLSTQHTSYVRLGSQPAYFKKYL
jgi:hypothetical protein